MCSLNYVTVEPVYNGHPRNLRNWPLNTGGRLIQDQQKYTLGMVRDMVLTSTHCRHVESVNDTKHPNYQLIVALYKLFLYSDDGSHFKHSEMLHKVTCGLASVQGWPLNIGPLYTGSTLFSISKFKSPEVVRPVNVLPTCRVMSASMTIKGSVPDDIMGCF